MSQTAKKHIVYFVLFEGLEILDVAGPAEVLSQANSHLSRVHYEIHYVSSSKENFITSGAGLGLAAEPLPCKMPHIDTLVVPGGDVHAIENAVSDSRLMGWIEEAAETAKRVTSVCSGALILGQLGLLVGKRVTTHWLALSFLQASNPKARVEEDTLYTHDGDLWTSAGVLSGIDMMLAVVTHDHGAKLALKIARHLVVYVIRDGGQNQFSGPMDLQTKAGRSEFVTLIGWLEARLSQDITVEAMAERMNTSVRTLHRRCREIFEMSPAQLLSELRLEHSRTLLHQASIAIKSIAYECGFSNPSSYSKAFSRRFGVSPQRYRDRFQGAE